MANYSMQPVRPMPLQQGQPMGRAQPGQQMPPGQSIDPGFSMDPSKFPQGMGQAGMGAGQNIDPGFNLSPEQLQGLHDKFGMGRPQNPLDQRPGGMPMGPMGQPPMGQSPMAGLGQGLSRPSPRMSGFNKQIASDPRLRNMTKGQQQRWASRQAQPAPRMGGAAPSGQYGALAGALNGAPIQKM